MERQASYGEMVILSNMFEEQCEEKGIEWTDMEVKDEAYLDFCSQWEYGDDNPEVLLCGYGYTLKSPQQTCECCNCSVAMDSVVVFKN